MGSIHMGSQQGHVEGAVRGQGSQCGHAVIEAMAQGRDKWWWGVGGENIMGQFRSWLTGGQFPLWFSKYSPKMVNISNHWQIVRNANSNSQSHSRPVKQKLWRWGPAICFNKSSKWVYSESNLRAPELEASDPREWSHPLGDRRKYKVGAQ